MIERECQRRWGALLLGLRKRQQSLVILFDCLLLCLELHYRGFDVLASRAFEGASIETRFY